MNVCEKVPNEFANTIQDMIRDLETTIPEISPIVGAWWKNKSAFDYIDEETERELAFTKAREQSIKFVFEFAKRKYPPNYSHIMNQNEEIFNKDSVTDTEFLPQIHFKDLWHLNISENTKITLWKYLQLILIFVVFSVENRDAFGDCAKNFQSEETLTKLEETLRSIHDVFESHHTDGPADESSSNINMSNIPRANDIHGHFSGLFEGKLGKLAKEIAEETAQNLNMDMDNVSTIDDVFKQMFQNPNKLMEFWKSSTSKLDSKIKSGEINQTELMNELMGFTGKMKDMPGMENVQELMKQMGLSNVPNLKKGNNTKNERHTSQSSSDMLGMENIQEIMNQLNSSTNMSTPLDDTELLKLFETPTTQKKNKKNKTKK